MQDLMPESFKRRITKQLVASLAIIAVIVGIIIVLNIDINKRMARIENRKSEILLQTQAMLVLGDLKKEAVQATSDMVLLETALPTRDQLISFPRELEQSAKANGVDLGFSFGSETPSSGSQPGSIRFTMSLGGTLDGLLDFLKVFETNKYFINLSSVDLSRKEGSRYALGTTGEIYTR